MLQKHPWFQRFGVRAVSALVMLVAAWWLVARIASSGE
jgi:negative regulator of sigma E activity